MEQRLVTLNKQYLCDEILSAEDLNTLVLFINNIINYINGLDSVIGSPGRDGQDGQDGLPGRDGNDGLDGHSPQINIGEDGYWYIDGHNTGVRATSSSGFDYNLNQDPVFLNALALIRDLNTRIQNLGIGLGSLTSYDINQIIDSVIDALRTWDWNTIVNVSGWNPDMQAYLTQIGLVTSEDWENGKLKTQVRISSIITRLNSIEQSIALNTIITDGNGNSESLESIKTSIALWISNNLSLTKMLAMIEGWELDSNGKPTIYSALSETRNTAEKTEAGLQAMYQQYAGVISRDHYTNSLIEGLANEQKAKTTLSSAFGDYIFDNYGNPIYETYDAPQQNSNSITGYYPVYELDENGNAIPYTGIVIKYIRYEDEQGNLVHDPESATKLIYLNDSSLASNMIEKTPLTNADGSVKKINNKVVYDITPIRDDYGNIVKAKKAFKVYYKVDSSTINPRPDNGQYGNYYANDSYCFAENILEPERDDQNNIIMTKYLYDNSLDTTIDYNYFTDYLSLSYDNDGNIITDSTLVNNDYINPVYVGFIDNYGPDVIAYHKARKLIIRNTSGLITESNLEGACATLFALSNNATQAIATFLVSSSQAFIDAVALAAANLTNTTEASTKLIADASMYEARMLYKDSSDNWHDIYTEEEIFCNSSLNNNGLTSNTRVKVDGNGNIIWIQDSIYIYNDKEYSYEELIKNYPSISYNSVTRLLLYILSDGTVSTTVSTTPKKKLIKQATAGVISVANSDDYVMANIYSKLENKYAGLTAIIQKIHEKTENGTNYYLFKYIGTTNSTYTNGMNYWLQDPSPGSDWLEEYEIEGNVTLSADEINIIGNTVIDSLTSNSAFIDNLTVSKIYSRFSYNGGYNHLRIDSSKGFRTYFTLNLNDSEPNDTTTNVTNIIRMDGSGKLARGKIYWDVNGNLTANNININYSNNGGSNNGGSGNTESILLSNGTNHIKINPIDGISVYSTSSGIDKDIHKFDINGEMSLCNGNIIYANDSLNIIGKINATTFGVVKQINGNSILYSIEFTTVSQTLYDNYDGIRDAGFSVGEPIGLLYNKDNNTLDRFFDFAPVNKGTFNSTGEVVYVIRGANNGKVIMKYRDYPIYKVITDSNNTNNENKYISLPRSNGPLAQITENDNCYLIKTRNATGPFLEGSEMYSGLILSDNLGSYVYSLKSVTIYLLITITDGIKNFINNYYVIETNLIGNSLQTYVPASLTVSNVNVNGIPTNSSVHPLIANTAYSTSPIPTDPPVFGAIVTNNGVPGIQDIVRGPNN